MASAMAGANLGDFSAIIAMACSTDSPLRISSSAS